MGADPGGMADIGASAAYPSWKDDLEGSEPARQVRARHQP